MTGRKLVRYCRIVVCKVDFCPFRGPDAPFSAEKTLAAEAEEVKPDQR